MSEQETPDPSNDEPSLEEPSFEERSISQVGAATRQNNVLVVIFGVAIVALLLWFVNRSEDAETSTRLTAAASAGPAPAGAPADRMITAHKRIERFIAWPTRTPTA